MQGIKGNSGEYRGIKENIGEYRKTTNKCVNKGIDSRLKYIVVNFGKLKKSVENYDKLQ